MRHPPMTLMTTETLNRPEVDNLDMTEFEEAKPCEGVTGVKSDPCPNEAKWACWVSHDYRRCPFELNLCTPHKENAVKVWEHLISCKAGHTCPKCKAAFRGKQLNQVFRALEL